MASDFTAKIKIKGVNPYVEVPPRVSAEFGKRGFVPVVMTLQGQEFKANLVPVGGGRHVLYLNLLMRKPTKTKVGDRVRVGLSLDTQSRELALPEDLKAELVAEGLLERFLKYPPSHRKEFIRYLESMKTSESRKRVVGRVIAHVKEGRMWYGRKSAKTG